MEEKERPHEFMAARDSEIIAKKGWPRSKTRMVERLRKLWYLYSRNKAAVVGLLVILLIVCSTIFAPFVAPYPEHVGAVVDFDKGGQPPSLRHLCGTDLVGRDVFSRILFGYRFSLLLGIVVLSISVPIGITIGLVAGYFRDTWIETIFMRINDVFLSVPPLLLALTISAVLPTNIFYSMLAVTVAYWTFQARIIYGMTKQISSEAFILAAEAIGASKFHILFREILPNCVGVIFTKMSIDMGLIILMGATLSFVGLGVQPPKPDLGTMMADGAKFLPGLWWMTVFPALAIILLVYCFNIVGDGLTEAISAQEM